jgi:hypothetical protein
LIVEMEVWGQSRKRGFSGISKSDRVGRWL